MNKHKSNTNYTKEEKIIKIVRDTLEHKNDWCQERLKLEIMRLLTEEEKE